MTTLNIKKEGAWTPIAGDVAVTNPVNDFISFWTPTPWTPVTFQNGWVNQGGGFQSVQYRKVGDEVQLRGSMKSGTIGVAFTLPVGYRPPAGGVLIFGADSANTHCRVDVRDDGTVYVQTGTPASWVSLASSFSTIL